MKKIGIITIIDNNNYGNRLQNYAVQKILENLNMNVITILNEVARKNKNININNIFQKMTNKIKNKVQRIIYKDSLKNRYELFEKFNKNVKFSEYCIKEKQDLSEVRKEFNYFIVGSDQVWNPLFNRLSDIDLLCFANEKQKISFSASFGISHISNEIKGYVKQNLVTFKEISVRENQGKKIVEELTGRKDVQVLVDPTMLLTAEEWDKVSKKPEQLKTDKYILNYFLGELSKERRDEIDRIAKENGCEVINILDKNSPFYQTGPSEFLYLEKNAFLICTDSFHSSIFAILYNKPFIVFDRENKNWVSMNSRIETLINKFNLKNREFTGQITKENLQHDYTEAYEILKREREKSIKFLKKALDIEE